MAASMGCSEESTDLCIVSIGKGWAKDTVNAVIFRRNAVVSHNDLQYVAYYDVDSSVVLAKCKLGSTNWETRKIPYKGQAIDVYNSITISLQIEKS